MSVLNLLVYLAWKLVCFYVVVWSETQDYI